MSTYCKNCKPGKPCGNYHIYIIDLKSNKNRDILKDSNYYANTFREHDQIRPTITNKKLFNGNCIYVGITKNTVEDRFKQHKVKNNESKFLSNNYVRKYASKIKSKAFMKNLFVHLNPLPFSEQDKMLAESFEQEYAKVLRSLGFAAYSGYVENKED